MTKKIRKKSLAPIAITNCSFTTNHPQLPSEFAPALERLAEAIKENAISAGKVADALKGPDNNSIGLKIG